MVLKDTWTHTTRSLTAKAPPNTLPPPQANGHKICYKDWHSCVHAPLDYETMLHPDALVREILHS